MFEASFIKKYLTPRRKHLSVSIIALLSVVVITLVVWLIVVFLSVTEGIEKNWLHKLTTLNAPVRIKPTKEYFSSYYYTVDSYAQSSEYMAKTIGQKARALLADPYDPEIDEQLPKNIPPPDRDRVGDVKHLVKECLATIETVKEKFPSLTYQDVERSGALLRLEMVREEEGAFQPSHFSSTLTNVSYLSSFSEQNPRLAELLLPPSSDDLNQILFQVSRSEEKKTMWIPTLEDNVEVKELAPKGQIWRLPYALLPEHVPFAVEPYKHQSQVSHLMVPVTFAGEPFATIEKRDGLLFYHEKGQKEEPLHPDTPLFSFGKSLLCVEKVTEEGKYLVSAQFQGHQCRGRIGFDGLEIVSAKFAQTKFGRAPLWPYLREDGRPVLPSTSTRRGVVLAKNFRENGVRIGDEGTLSYTGSSLTGAQEMQIPIFVTGFYDPGLMAVGNKCILVPSDITRAINNSASSFTLDRSEANQIHIWFSDLKQAPLVKEALIQELDERGLSKYFAVETFTEYDFAKDLLHQFQSDKYLFTLVGIIILLVACTNIISLLVLLVSDKKKEIGILRAMGAKKRSIAAIFAFAGASLGSFSCLFGIGLALLTLRNIDALVGFLSFIQGQDALSSQFFGSHLPSEMSHRALIFALIVTPLLSLLAGLVPAIKAARMNPCDTLKAE